MNQNITSGLQIQGSYKGSTTKIMEQNAALVSLYTKYSIDSYRVKARMGFDGNGKYITETTDLSNGFYNRISISGGDTLGPGDSCTIGITGPTIDVRNGRISGIGQAFASTTISLSADIATTDDVTAALEAAKTYADGLVASYVLKSTYNDHYHNVDIDASGNAPKDGGTVNVTGNVNTGGVDAFHRA